MSLSLAATPVRVALARLIDYAGLFPPAKLAMAPALAAYEAARQGPHAWMLGHFIVPATRLGELLAARRSAEAPCLGLSVILDVPANQRRWLGDAQTMLAEIAAHRAHRSHITIEALEVPIPAVTTQRETFDAAIGQCAMLLEQAGLRDIPSYIEIPRDGRWRELLPGALAAVARHRLRAKVRCGGVTAEAFPNVDELATFIHAAAEHALPFKATAGLHHPVRHVDSASGFMMHGFLNVLAASALGSHDDRAAVTDALTQENPDEFTLDGEALVIAGHRLDVAQLEAARERFVAYGSCSFAEPVDDLIALQLLTK